jgi:multiple sugar transport system ATP-binding protein
MGFALKMQNVPKAERNQRVLEAAKLLGLEDFLARKPKALSGGQRQRVAMGRAIVRQPHVFLMDEPLSNLDAKLRVSTRTQIAALQVRLGVTTVYVTHDQVEAMTMGHRVAVMKDGILQQVDAPMTLYDKPDNLFVAGFIGSPAMNLISGNVTEGGVQVGDYVVPVPREVLSKAAGESTLTIGVRPEFFTVADEGIAVDVSVVEELGSDTYLYGTLAGIDEDAKLRVSTRTQIASLQRRLGVTTVYVTHDQTEALTMGDRIAVLKDGLLQQLGSPLDLYSRPGNVFVASFIGSPAMNIGTFAVSDAGAKVGDATLAVSREALAAVKPEDEGKITVGFRPESLDVVPEGTVGAIPVDIDLVEELGSDAYAYGELAGIDSTVSLQSQQIIVRVDPHKVPPKGATTWVKVREGEQHNFSAATGERLPN